MKTNYIYERFHNALRGAWLGFQNRNLSLGAWQQSIDGFTSGRKIILGDKVTENTALTVPTVLACTKIISESVSSLPCVLYEPKGPSGKQPAIEEDEYDLMHAAPNDNDTACEFLENYTTSIILRGNGFAWTPRNNRGRVQAIWPLRNDQIQVNLYQGVVTYTTTAITGAKTVLFQGDDMWHTKAFSRDGILGASIIRQAAELFGQSMAQSEFSAAIYQNGATLRGVVSTDYELGETELQDLKANWKDKYAGAENSGRMLFLPYNLKFKPITMSPVDIALIESMNLTERQIAALFGVPLHMLQVLQKGTFNTVEQQGAEFIQLCLRKWCNRLEQSLNARLLNSGQRGRGLHFKFDLNDIMRGSTADRSAYYMTMIQNSIMTPNEIRIKEGLNPLEGLDEVLIAMNYTTASEDSDDIDADDDGQTTGNTKEGANTTPGPAAQPVPSNTKKPTKVVQKPSKGTSKKSHTDGIEVAEEVLKEAIEKVIRKEMIVRDKYRDSDYEEQKKQLDKFHSTHRKYCQANLEKPLARVFKLSGKQMQEDSLFTAASTVSQWLIATTFQADEAEVRLPDIVNGAHEAVLQQVGAL